MNISFAKKLEGLSSISLDLNSLTSNKKDLNPVIVEFLDKKFHENSSFNFDNITKIEDFDLILQIIHFLYIKLNTENKKSVEPPEELKPYVDFLESCYFSSNVSSEIHSLKTSNIPNIAPAEQHSLFF